MHRRQTAPSQWLIAADRAALGAATRLPRGSGILLLKRLSAEDMRRLRHVAQQRELVIVMEQRRTARRVHDIRELRSALLVRVPLILLSPIYRTGSHPEWRPLARMRAAALARLGGRKLIALGA